LKNAELISVDFGCRASLKYMKSSDLQKKIEKQISLYQSWDRFEKECSDFLFSTQSHKNGDKLTLKEHLFTLCIYTNTKKQTYSDLKLIEKRRLF